MEPLKSLKQLRGFIGAVIYYRDMWPHCSQVFSPLTEKTGVKTEKFNWAQDM